MKIGIDCRLINKIQNTGISRYTEFLIDYYISRFGVINVILISNDISYQNGGCKVIFTKLRPYNILHFFQFSYFVNSIGLDLLHVPFYSALSTKNNDFKVIVTVHDLMYRLVDDFFGTSKILNKLKLFYFDFIVKRSLINADVIISVSETTKNDVFTEFGFNSIHIPEDSNVESNDDFSVLNKFNLLKKGYYFYCGNNRPHKNIDFIKKIFNNNLELPPLVLAGNGHQGNSANIIATGIVSEEELNALYKSAIAFVFPSRYEGFGLPVLESLRSETFVIASKIPAFLEFKSKNIFFFELENTEEFLNAIEKSRTSNFQTEDFLNQYDKKHIYQLNDKIVKYLLNNKTTFGN